MQSAASPCSKSLASIQHGIAALCYERTRVQMEQNKFRNCVRDERHEAWDAEMKQIEEKRKELIAHQTAIIKQSHKCGVGVDGQCI